MIYQLAHNNPGAAAIGFANRSPTRVNSKGLRP